MSFSLEPPSVSERLRRFAADLQCGWWWDRRQTITDMRVLAGKLEIIERAAEFERRAAGYSKET